jgi:hypothetical protein
MLAPCVRSLVVYKHSFEGCWWALGSCRCAIVWSGGVPWQTGLPIRCGRVGLSDRVVGLSGLSNLSGLSGLSCRAVGVRGLSGRAGRAQQPSERGRQP